LKNLVQRELIIYIGLLVILAAIQHNDLLIEPAARLDRLFNGGQQSIFHPLVWVTPVYLITLMFRLMFRWVKKFLTKKSSDDS
jgi:hypothetical protein